MKSDMRAALRLTLSFGFSFSRFCMNLVACDEIVTGILIFQFQLLYLLPPLFFQFVIYSLNGAEPIKTSYARTPKSCKTYLDPIYPRSNCTSQYLSFLVLYSLMCRKKMSSHLFEGSNKLRVQNRIVWKSSKYKVDYIKIDNNVFRLYVSVDNIVYVRVINSFEHLF